MLNCYSVICFLFAAYMLECCVWWGGCCLMLGGDKVRCNLCWAVAWRGVASLVLGSNEKWCWGVAWPVCCWALTRSGAGASRGFAGLTCWCCCSCFCCNLDCAACCVCDDLPGIFLNVSCISVCCMCVYVRLTAAGVRGYVCVCVCVATCMSIYM